MLKKEYNKQWQQINADKARSYTNKYKSRKRTASVTLDEWVALEIEKRKPPEQPLGGWIRERLEKWAQASRSGILRNPDDLF